MSDDLPNSGDPAQGDLATVCPECGGTRSPRAAGDGYTQCPACLEAAFRAIDAAFLENYARFGARSRQVIAEVCLRALALSDVSDRKILGAMVYEQFVQTSAALVNLYYALLGRRDRSIAQSFLSFRLDQTHCLNFFADLAEFSPTELLDALGLVHPDRVSDLFPDLLKREERELKRALHDAIRDLERLADYQELGETALVRASEQMQAVFALTDRLPWREDGSLAPDKVAALAIDARYGGVSLSALSVDEVRLAVVVDGIDVMTRLSRNLIYAYLSINSPEVLQEQPRWS
jgi:hypothetical protein